MAIIAKVVNADEKVWQNDFYRMLFGDDLEGINLDRSTDGYTKGIIFEHKTSIQSYGESKALGQALIYLTRFNRDGVPVPAKICLVGQDEGKCYVYDTENYLSIINNIPEYANLKASEGIPGFTAGARSEVIKFDIGSAIGLQEVLKFIQRMPEVVKVDINEHNVYGWATFYYDNAVKYKQKPEKKKFFEELKKPIGTLKEFIHPWTGQETEFKYIMDMLNDPMTQKKLGAFYTPPAYCKKATELVLKAIERVPEGNDYVIIDRCAGTGNLQMFLDDGGEDILSHCILSTYELKEWMVLKDRFGGRVRYIIPPIPANPDELPELNEEGFLSGANALTRDIIDNPEVKKYLDNPKCTIILFENPPYAETTSIDNRKVAGNDVKADWKQFCIVDEMKKEVSGVATNDMANAFIWSGFKYFLRQPTDSFIVFSPIKYWKGQKLIQKKFIEGYAFNRKHFHANSESTVSCIYWSNEDDKYLKSFKLEAFNLDNNQNLIDEGTITVKQVSYLPSEKLYDNRTFDTDEFNGIICANDGKESDKYGTSSDRVPHIYNENLLGYITSKSSGIERCGLEGMLLRTAKYDGNGFFLRSDNFLQYLPVFAQSKYGEYDKRWTSKGMLMKSGDKAEQYFTDVRNGSLEKFLCQTLIWTGLTHYSHIRSLYGSDERFYKNELCFDDLDGKTTLARQKLEEFIDKGYQLTGEENALFKKWNEILQKVKIGYLEEDWIEYNPKYTYGLYQIDEEINIKIIVGYTNDNQPVYQIRDGDLNEKIKDLKKMLKEYYLNNLKDTLFEYEFLK